jgi:hypothetical protein
VSRVPALVVVAACLAAAACTDPERERQKKTTIPTYDSTTGKLKELTFDFNKNGKIDTWTQMDGAHPVSARQDLDEDGRMDRWEYYDTAGTLVKVGLSRKDSGNPDTWAYPNARGEIDRVEVSTTGDPERIDRWESYVANTLVKAAEDTNRDGRPDKWEEHENGAVKRASFDENHDGIPDRRLSYDGAGSVVLIETVYDGSSGFTKQTPVR